MSNQKKWRGLLGVQAVYVRDDEILITGYPEEDDDTAHNCDEMECSSMEHVLLRGRSLKKGYNEGMQEEGEEL